MMLSRNYKFILAAAAVLVFGFCGTMLSSAAHAQWVSEADRRQQLVAPPNVKPSPQADEKITNPSAQIARSSKTKTSKNIKESTPSPVKIVETPWEAEHQRAVQMARAGDTNNASIALRDLYQQHPNDIVITRDYLAVLSWEEGHDSDVIKLYKTLIDPSQPDYVMLAVAHAYRDLKQPDDARGIYEFGLNRNPSSEAYAAGVIYSLSDGGYAEAALNSASENLHQYGNRIEILMAGADAADQYGQNDLALTYYEAAVALAPQNRDAVRGLIRSKARSNDPVAALKIANENPGVLPAREYHRIQGDVVANLIRKGQSEPASEANRFVLTDRALAMSDSLIASWSKEGADSAPDVTRLRLDRIIALRNRSRMNEVISEYQAFQNQGVTIPPYVLSSVGDAYLYLREPEMARDLYLEVLKSDPKNFDVRRQLFYAYVECDDYKNAYATIDDLQNDRPYWSKLGSGADPLAKRQETIAQLAAGAGRQYGGQVHSAENWLMPVVAANPSSATSYEVLGNLDMAHGWPRKALPEYQAAIAANKGKNIGVESNMVGTYLQLQRYPEAEAKAKDLAERMPENLGVQRAVRDEEIHNMAELRIRAGYSFRPMTSESVNGGEAYGIDTVFYSPPIGHNWRIFAGEFYTHQNEPRNEGAVGFSRSTFGAEYRNQDWTLNLAPTFNLYNGSQRLGGAGDVTYAINDQWTIAGSGEIFSRETPLRALNQGTTSNFFNTHATWREDENREVRFGGNVQPFSDSNVRSGLDASYVQNVYTIPDFTIDGLADVAESQNSKDANRSYYNPKSDFIALLGPRATQILYQRYSKVYSHSLRLTPGVYWEDHYGASAAFRARYEQRIRYNNVFETGLGINYSRQSYDGNPENDVSLTLDLLGRF